jgi:hypothetical protein
MLCRQSLGSTRWPSRTTRHGSHRRRGIAQSRSGMQAVASACRRSLLARRSSIYHSISAARIFTLKLVLLLLKHRHHHYQIEHLVLVSSDGEWITYNSKNWVWLPSEYRPSCSAVLGKTIGIGVGTGKVWICNFKVDNL